MLLQGLCRIIPKDLKIFTNKKIPLEKFLPNPRLLKGAAAQDLTYKRRYELMFVALINVAGDPLYQEFRKQEEMVKILTTAAEKVQVAKEKDVR